MKAIPLDRTVHWMKSTADAHLYHIWRNDDGGVTVQVGCHRSRLTNTEARTIAGFLTTASTKES